MLTIERCLRESELQRSAILADVAWPNAFWPDTCAELILRASPSADDRVNGRAQRRRLQREGNRFRR
jgi:hypothetical protein